MCTESVSHFSGLCQSCQQYYPRWRGCAVWYIFMVWNQIYVIMYGYVMMLFESWKCRFDRWMDKLVYMGHGVKRESSESCASIWSGWFSYAIYHSNKFDEDVKHRWGFVIVEAGRKRLDDKTSYFGIACRILSSVCRKFFDYRITGYRVVGIWGNECHQVWQSHAYEQRGFRVDMAFAHGHVYIL